MAEVEGKEKGGDEGKEKDDEPGLNSYFWNKLSGETSWEKPSSLQLAFEHGAISRSPKTGSSATWSAAKATISSGLGYGGSSSGGPLETTARGGSVELQENPLSVPSFYARLPSVAGVDSKQVDVEKPRSGNNGIFDDDDDLPGSSL
jgi:hypothetical protein